MAAWVNKWLLLLGFPLSLIQSGATGPQAADGRPQPGPRFSNMQAELRTTDRGEPAIFHPFHVSTTEINHNAGDRTLEISCRIFTDDFETALAKQFNTKADFSDQKLQTSMDSLVKKYVISRLQLKADGKPVALSYLGYEKENEAVYAYLQADNIATVKKVEAVNSIMHNIFDDQINIMHVVVGGKRKSSKLDYPVTQATFDY